MVVPLAVIAAIVAFPPSIRPYYALGVAVGWGLLRGGTSPALAGYHAVAMLALLLLLAAVITRVLGTGIATLGAAIFLSICASGAYSLWQQPPAAFQWEAVGVVLATLFVMEAAIAFTRPAQ
ncbi:MAG: hypothetical protein FJW31_24410 [Acidobacteria bacterium]|nr:hypothetical protein [Acidobacteriota bacterium]